MGTCNKLKHKKIAPCCILEKINDNSYKIKLSLDIHTRPTFNVQNLTIYHAEWDRYKLEDELHVT